MTVEKNFDLTGLNTFGVPARAKFFVELASEVDIPALFSLPEFHGNEKLFLGGGSNILFTRDWDGIVVWNRLRGVEVLNETDTEATVRAASGEVWHDLVCFAIARGLWGIENLSLIPGSVGAAPMQNIGAYGAELKDTLETVEAYDVITGEKRIFQNAECRFGYRDSIFKNEAKGKYFISAITLRLSKTPKPNAGYRALAEHIASNQIEDLSLENLSRAVCDIRRSKLPDPKVLGNAGSFFKNVFVDERKLRGLLAEYPEMPHFKEGELYKIPAGWLIEQAGWKGKRLGNAGVHDKQALVLVNHSGATGAEIKALADGIVASVEQKFGITLAPEVNFV